MKGTYATVSPLAYAGFNHDNYPLIGFAYFPGTENGRMLKRELAAVFVEEQFKIVGESDEQDAILKTGITYNKEMTMSDARKLGRVMKASAVVIIKKADFTADGKADYISLFIADPFGGLLAEAVYKGGDSPDRIDRAARSIIYHIQMEDFKRVEKIERDDNSSDMH